MAEALLFLELLLHFRDDLGEDVRMFQGDHREDLAVELDVRFLQSIDELGVAHPVFAGGGVKAHRPERAEIALLLLAATVSVYAGFQNSGFGKLNLRFAAPHVTLRLGEKVAAALGMHYSAFDSGHMLVGQKVDKRTMDGRTHVLRRAL